MTLEELNESVRSGDYGEIIRVEEARQVKALSKIADLACGRPKIRLVLLAGASSAGKTTTAKRLCTQLRVNHRAAMLLSTDDYFVGDALNPRDSEGNLDYEHLECVDLKRLSEDVNALFDGREIEERRFDFQCHEPGYTGRKLSLPKGGFIVIEGIHALNPRLTEGVADETKFRVFVDPAPSLDIFGGMTQSSEGCRLLRRLVRDNHFRKMNPVRTIRLWPKVMEGEAKWIRPFAGLADATFDSYLDYELSVLKPYVGGLLALAQRECGDVPVLVRNIELLKHVEAMPPDRVPGDSIIRETIGGSQLDY